MGLPRALSGPEERHLDATALRFDARRRGLLTAEERRAYRQALGLLVGERYLVATVPEE